VKTPNARSLLARVLGGWWQWFAAPEHVQLFSRGSLQALLESRGFVPELVVTRRGDADPALLELLRGSVRRMVRRRSRGVATSHPRAPTREPLSRRRWYRFLAGAVGLAGAPLDWILALFDSRAFYLGPELLVVARRSHAD
jgi:hypothetical protein